MVAVSVTKLSRFITLLPSPVMLGFCNGLAIVIGLSQIHPFKDPETHHWKEGRLEMFLPGTVKWLVLGGLKTINPGHITVNILFDCVIKL